MGSCHFPLTKVISNRQDLLRLHLELMGLLLALQVGQMHLCLQELLLQGSSLSQCPLAFLVFFDLEVNLTPWLTLQVRGLGILLGEICPLKFVAGVCQLFRGVDDGLGLGLHWGLLLVDNSCKAIIIQINEGFLMVALR